MGDEHRYREIFVPDCGSLIDIRTFDVTADDWQSLLNFLFANYLLSYSGANVVQEIPQFSSIWKMREEEPVSIQILLPGFTVNMHFFADDEIEMDVLPEDINSHEKAEAVFTLVKNIARLLKKEVFLLGETSISEPEELKQMAICFCDPCSLEIRCLH